MKTVLITGKGRSGTTWLAQILNTYVHCAYKHEPFLPGKRSGYTKLREQLEDGDIATLRRAYEEVAVKAVHGIDQPPFPSSKSVRAQDPRLLTALYRVGNKVPRLRFLFEVYGRPHMHEDADVLIKDVNFPNELLERLCHVVEPWLVPIIRNPFANISSHLKGVELGQFASVTDIDRTRVAELIDGQADASLTAYRDKLDSLTVMQFETVRWRLQVEPLISFAERYGRSRLVVYEDLCTDPMGTTEELFEFLEWRMKPTTRAFIERSTSGARRERTSKDAYYSVYRDPRESMNKWRDDLTTDQQAEIASVFSESPYRDLWPDLPLVPRRRGFDGLKRC